jgi:hypothetical protein
LLIQTIAVARSQSQKALGVGFMWIEKLLGGVLRVLTPLGARYIRPALAQRIYLLWIFRNFKVLPLQVLTPRQRRMIDALCGDPRFVAPAEPDGWEAPILGTLERRPPIAPTPDAPTPGSRTGVSSFATDLSHAERRS